MKFKKWFLMGFCSLTLLAGMIGTGQVSAAEERSPVGPQVFATIDGVQKLVNVGSVVATGEMVTMDTGKTGVQFSHVQIIVQGTDTNSHAIVRMKVNDAGELVIDQIIFDNAKSPVELTTNGLPEPKYESTGLMNNMAGTVLGPTSHYRMYAEQSYNDCVGLDCTVVKAAMNYYDSGSGGNVWGGSDWFYDGWTAGWFPWWVRYTLGSGWDPYGTDGDVHINCDASFADPGEDGYPFYWHWQKIQVNAWPGGYNWWSDFSGQLLQGGWLETEGWRNIV